MPARRRRGQGFTRKKKRKSTSPASSSGRPAKKALNSTASKRKAEQALAVTLLTRRASPRLAAFAKRKKMEKESLVVLQKHEIHHRLVVPSKGNIDDNNNVEMGSEDFEDTIGQDFEDTIPIVGEDEEVSYIFDRGTKEPQDIVLDDASLKEVEEDFKSHAVLMYFWRTGGLTVTRRHVKEWIYNNVGDRETVGSIRYCRDVAKGFFSVYFEQAVARNKALETKGQQRGLQVTVFPWCSATVNDQGQQCSPRMLVLPGLPDQYLAFLPAIGNSLGTYIGSIGALDPDADMEQESASDNVTPASDNTSPRVAVMLPPEWKIPQHIRLQIRPGVYKEQPICEHYEQLSSSKAVQIQLQQLKA